MASVQHSPPVHSPPGPDAKRPKGILKNPSQTKSPTRPDAAPTGRERSMSSKEITIENTQINAGHRRSSSGARPSAAASRRQSAQALDDPDSSQRLKWDEANLYLTEQERSATMKINEPKTPYAKHYDPTEDPSDEDDINAPPLDEVAKKKVQQQEEAAAAAAEEGVSGQEGRHPQHKATRAAAEDDIPGLSLGEPEEEVPERKTSSSETSVHLDNGSATHSAEDYVVGESPEEREKHRRFEAARKQHYEMKNVAQLLGHPEDLPDDEDEDGPPPMPALPRVPNGFA